MKTPVSDEKHALVLSGGGANGAYAVGVMEALFNGGNAIEPSIFTGTSVGAFNAAVMASLFDRSCLASVRALRKLWLKRISAPPDGSNGVYRIRGDLLNRSILSCALEDISSLTRATLRRFLDLSTSSASISQRLMRILHLGDLISTTPFEQLLTQTVDPRRLLDPRARALRVITTNWDNGKVVVFYNRSEAKTFRPTVAEYERRPLTEGNAKMAIQASAAIPGVFPRVAIGDDVFVDGGMLMNTPLHPAIQAGGSVLHVIHFEPRLEPVPFGRAPSLLDTIERIILTVPAGQVTEDLALTQNVQRRRFVARRLQHYFDEQGEKVPPIGDDIVDFMQEFAKKPRITAHVYRPCRSLGGLGGLLDFRQERIIRLIEMGYDDTVHHACRANGCVV